jgi:hypothetical protein
MKKISIFFVGVIAIFCTIWYINSIVKLNLQEKKAYNKFLETNLGKDISGTDLASFINKSSNLNEKNNVLKDDNGIYIDNKQNSINIEIKFKDDDEVIQSEKIVKNGIDKFVELYGDSKFKLIKIDYHSKTKIVKYAYFEEQ